MISIYKYFVNISNFVGRCRNNKLFSIFDDLIFREFVLFSIDF